MRVGHWLQSSHSIICDNFRKDLFVKVNKKIIKNKTYISMQGLDIHWRNNKNISSWDYKRYHICSPKCIKEISEQQKIVYKEKVKQQKIDNIKQ